FCKRTAPLLLLECPPWRARGHPGGLTGGVCSACRGERAPTRHPDAPLSSSTIHSRAAEIRAAMHQQRQAQRLKDYAD
ncbi:hypothetical protein PV379_28850, partial [Streptomyces caniscabiei]|nr:hypothetical protein [Streptomyces caniscabiei]